jgi:hypothetical protein
MKSLALGISALIASALLAGCAVQFVSQYDPETDEGVSALHSELTAHFATLNQLAVGPNGQPMSPACKFENFRETYAQLAAQAHVLKVRNEVRDQNELTVAQLGLLEQNLGELLPATHRDGDGGCMTQGAILVARETMDQMFRAILKLELAKKQFRGGE